MRRARLATAVNLTLFKDTPAHRVAEFQLQAKWNGLFKRRLFHHAATGRLRDALAKVAWRTARQPGTGTAAGLQSRAEGVLHPTAERWLAGLRNRATAGAALAKMKRTLMWAASANRHRTSTNNKNAWRDTVIGGLEPRPHPPVSHAMDLLLTGMTTADDLGNKAFAAPLGVQGAGRLPSNTIGGSRCTPIAQSIVALTRGNLALLKRPWVPPGATWRVPYGMAADRIRYGECHLCGTGVTLSFWHILLQCPHAPLRAARATTYEAASKLVEGMCRRLRAAVRLQLYLLHGRDRIDNEPPAELIAVQEAATAALDVLHAEGWAWGSPDGGTALYRLAIGGTWPERLGTAGAAVYSTRSYALTRALGRLFDMVTVQGQFHRSLNTVRTYWATYHVNRLAKVWCEANSAALDDQGQLGHRTAHAIPWRPKTTAAPVAQDLTTADIHLEAPEEADADILDPDSDYDSVSSNSST